MHESSRYLEHLFETSVPGITVVAVLLGLVGLAVALNSYVRSTDFSLDPVRLLRQSLSLLWLVPVVLAFGLVGSRFATTNTASPELTPMSTGIRGSDESLAPISHVPGPAGEPIEPAWIHSGVVDLPDRTLVVVHGRQFATVAEAEEDALAQSVALIRDEVVRIDRRFGSTPVPAEVVRDAAVRLQYVEPIVRTTENAEFTVYRVHQQVELSHGVFREITPALSRAVAAGRLWTLGTVAGFLTLSFAVLAGYLRLDELADGRHRGRLRFAAASMFTAFGLIAAVLL